MSKGKRKKNQSKIVEKRIEVKEVLVKQEGEKPTKLEVAGFVISLVGVITSLGVPVTQVKGIFEKVMATAWVYPVWNAVFSLLLVYLIAEYQKLNQAFVLRKVKKLTGREAVYPRRGVGIMQVGYLSRYLIYQGLQGKCPWRVYS